MSRIEGIRRLLHIPGTRTGIERAVEDELEFHFDMTVRDLMANGMSPEDARRGATPLRRRERAPNYCRDRSSRAPKRRAEWWSAFARDFRYALRGLRLKPGFSIAVIATLGLGLGANATMFGIVDRLLFRPPNLLIAPERAARLYTVRMSEGKERQDSFTGYRRYLDFREQTRSFDAMTPWYWNYLAVGSGAATREMSVGVSGSDLWTMFDVKPVIGRFFTAQEDMPPGEPVVVISYAFWQPEFGGRADLSGRDRHGPTKYTVIGVAPEDFSGFSPNLWPRSFRSRTAAATSVAGVPWYETYTMTWFEVFARRKPGVTLQQANADLTNVYQQTYRAALAEPRNTVRGSEAARVSGPFRATVVPTGNDAKSRRG
jgi:hypothetical protein